MQNTGSRPYSEVDLSKDHQVAEYVVERWRTRHQATALLEEQWVENVSFFLGHHWHVWNPNMRRMEFPRRSRWRERPVENYLLPIVLREIADIVAADPTWKVRPVSTDLEDIMVARLGTKVAQNLWRTQAMDVKLIELAAWVATTGTAYLRSDWNPFSGPPFAISPEDFLGPMGVGDPEQMALYDRLRDTFGSDRDGVVRGFLGDIDIRVRSPFEIDMDRSATSWFEAQNLIDTEAVSVGWARSQFKRRDLEPDADTSAQLSRFYLEKVAALSESPGRHQFSSGRDTKDLVLLHRFWAWPTREYPRGYYAVVANERVLQSGDNPYRFAKPPYAPFKAIHVPGRFHGTCHLRQSISPQMDINLTNAFLAEARDRFGRPKYVTWEDSGVKDDDLQSPGKTVRCRSQEDIPGLLPLPQMPDWLGRLREGRRDALADISSQHEARQGKQPGSVRTGRGIDSLMEADARIQLPTHRYYRHGLSEIGSVALQQVAQFYSEGRLVQVYGHEEEVESLIFKGEQLFGPKRHVPGADYFQVYTEIVSQQPLTSHGREQRVQGLIQQGYFDITNPDHRERIAQMLEMGTTEPYLDERRLQRQNAIREFAMLCRGQPVPTNPYDDDLYHIQVKRQLQNRPEYRQVPDFGKRAVEMHIAEHAQKLLAQQQSQAQLMSGEVPGGAAPTGETPPGEAPDPLEEDVARRRAEMLTGA